MAESTGSNYISYAPVIEQSCKGRCGHVEIRVNSMGKEGTWTTRHCLLENVSTALLLSLNFAIPNDGIGTSDIKLSPSRFEKL